MILHALKSGRSRYVETRLLNDNEFVDLSVPGHNAMYSTPVFSLGLSGER